MRRRPSAGLIAVPVNFRLTGDEILYILRRLRCPRAASWKMRWSTPSSHPRARPAWPRARAPGLDRRHRAWARDYEALLAAPRRRNRPGGPVRADDTCALMYTSGTTGQPKGAMRSHAGQRADCAGHRAGDGLHARRYRPDGDADVPRELARTSATTFTARGCGLRASTTAAASTPRHCSPRWRTKGTTFTSLVPTHYIMMLGLPEATKTATTSAASTSC